jgi:hypothetical protein
MQKKIRSLPEGVTHDGKCSKEQVGQHPRVNSNGPYWAELTL